VTGCFGHALGHDNRELFLWMLLSQTTAGMESSSKYEIKLNFPYLQDYKNIK
jgi:hypothetical protein